ncbi:uncharacterized protein LOC142609187 [Castanea sativa]|uniref:uncharacterized protein LOC142609187 n=1 Tax=Castanea sativa TaxID=21020 RepID=UPI003F64FF5E
METRLDREGFKYWCSDLPYPNRLIVKHPNTGGGLALIWKKDVKMDLINYTVHHFLVRVVEEDGFVWFLTCFYGWSEYNSQAKSWALLNHLRSFVEGSWSCISDFNAILSSSEKLSRQPTQSRIMDDFREALELNNLADLGYQGYPFTWNNKGPGEANMKERLDQAVATGDWRDEFSLTTVTHLSSHASDHLPIILQT